MIPLARFSCVLALLWLFFGSLLFEHGSAFGTSATDTGAATQQENVLEQRLLRIDLALGTVHERLEQKQYNDTVGPVVQAIEELASLRQQYPQSSNMDRMLFLSIRAKMLMADFNHINGHLLYLPDEDKVLAQAYYKTNKSDYEGYLGLVYIGDEVDTLVGNYPNGQWADDVLYMKGNQRAHSGECESNTACRILRALNAFLPLLSRYPASPFVKPAVEEISGPLGAVTWDPRTHGDWSIEPSPELMTSLDAYYKAVPTFNDPTIRAAALYPLARVFIEVKQYKKAIDIYDNLETNHSIRDVRCKAAFLMFTYEDECADAKPFNQELLAKYTKAFVSPTESERIQALKSIDAEKITDHVLRFSLVLTVGDMSMNDASAIVRWRASEVVERLRDRLTSVVNIPPGYPFDHSSWPYEGMPYFRVITDTLILYKEPSSQSPLAAPVSIKKGSFISFPNGVKELISDAKDGKARSVPNVESINMEIVLDQSMQRTVSPGILRAVAPGRFEGISYGHRDNLFEPEPEGEAKIFYFIDDDIIEELSYVGEGECMYRFLGEVLLQRDCLYTELQVEYTVERKSKPVTEWWLSVKKGNKTLGWLKMDDKNSQLKLVETIK